MNQEQVLSLLRGAISAVGGYAVGKGWIPADQVPVYLGLAPVLAALIWGYIAHTNKSLVASAQSVPAAQVVVSDPKLASEGVQVAPANAETVKVDVPKPA